MLPQAELGATVQSGAEPPWCRKDLAYCGLCSDRRTCPWLHPFAVGKGWGILELGSCMEDLWDC